ncbi:hypothetical protein [Xanthobacter agilis]
MTKVANAIDAHRRTPTFWRAGGEGDTLPAGNLVTAPDLSGKAARQG